MPIFPGRLGVHTRPQCREIERLAFAEELAKPEDLRVLGHGGSLLAQEDTAY